MAVREGFTSIMPMLMVGASTLIFKFFPIIAYQHFIETAMNGKVVEFLDIIFNSTFGMLSIYISVSVSIAYIRHFPDRYNLSSAPIISLICFLIIGYSPDMTAFGVKGVFLAIIFALLSTKLLVFLTSLKIKKHHSYIDGSNIRFNRAVNLIIPAMITISVFAVINIDVIHIFKVNNLFELCINTVYAIFLPLGRSFISAFLISVLSSLLWFFGIHGNNVFEPIVDTLFTPAVDVNIALAAVGQAPTEIFTKQFFDVFIYMGGSGTSICLLLLLLLFSKRKSAKKLAKISSLSILFNINELMVFGFPIMLNGFKSYYKKDGCAAKGTIISGGGSSRNNG